MQSNIDPALEQQVRNQLTPNEELLWLAQPGRFSLRNISPAISGLLPMLFAIVCLLIPGAAPNFSASIRHPMPWIYILLLLGGLALVASSFWLQDKASKTVYAVTSKRALILEGILTGNMTVRSITQAQLLDRECNQNVNGSGDLMFNVSSDEEEDTSPLSFYGIANVKDVDDLISVTFERRPSA